MLVIGAINQKTKQVRLKIVKYRTRTEAEKFIQNISRSDKMAKGERGQTYSSQNLAMNMLVFLLN